MSTALATDATTGHHAATSTLTDCQGAIWEWDLGLNSWIHDDGRRFWLRDRPTLYKERGPLSDIMAPTVSSAEDTTQLRVQDPVHGPTAPPASIPA